MAATRQRACDLLQNRFIFQHRLQNGVVRTVEVHSTPIEQEGQRLLFSIIHDITERKRAEDALRENEKRLHLAMESASEGVWEWEYTTGLVTFDKVALQMVGYEADFPPQKGDWWIRRIHPEDQPVVEKTYAAFMEGETSRYEAEFRLANKDDNYTWVVSTAHIIRVDEQGNPLLVVGIHRDITERKQAEEALRHTTELLNETGDMAHVACLHNFLAAIAGDAAAHPTIPEAAELQRIMDAAYKSAEQGGVGKPLNSTTHAYHGYPC